MGEAKDIGDITAGELLELLADDEMIEGGYDREEMVALLYLCRAGLQVLCRQIDGLHQELAELRAELGDRYTIEPRWEDPDARDDGRLRPDYYRLVGPDGNDVDIEVDGSELVDWLIDRALRQQAAAVCKRIELSDPLGVELGAVLALVPRDRDLIVRHPSDCEADAAWQEPFAAGPFDPPRGLATGYGPTREAAILAATRKLLGLSEDELRRGVSGSPAEVLRAAMALVDEIRDWDRRGDPVSVRERALIDAVEQLRASTAAEPRRTCETCEHWDREGVPAKSGAAVARHCSRVDGWRHPDGWCDDHSAAGEADTDPAPGSDEQLPGVSVAGNVVRSEGDSDA